MKGFGDARAAAFRSGQGLVVQQVGQLQVLHVVLPHQALDLVLQPLSLHVGGAALTPLSGPDVVCWATCVVRQRVPSVADRRWSGGRLEKGSSVGVVGWTLRTFKVQTSFLCHQQAHRKR